MSDIDRSDLAALANGDHYDLAAAQVADDIRAAKQRLAAQHPDLAPPEWSMATT